MKEQEDESAEDVDKLADNVVLCVGVCVLC
jgi:hypothetical protein